MGALTGEMVTTDQTARIRLTQALAEMPADLAQGALRQLAHDDDRVVALIASALLGVLRR